MGRLFTAASSDHASNTGPAVVTKPISMSCWYKPTNFAQQAQLVVLQSNTTANREFGLAVSTGAAVQAIERGSSSCVATGSTISAGVWSHCGASFATGGSGQRIAYANGAASAANTTSDSTQPTPERTDIGAYYPTSIGTFGSFANGVIAVAAIWALTLSPTDFAALARGVCPLLIRPGSLRFYAPLFGGASPEPDYTNGQKPLTLAGTSLADGPPIATPFPAS